MAILTSIFSKLLTIKILLSSFSRMKSSVTGHVETNASDDECLKCQESYNGGEYRLYCPVCYQWHYEDSFYK